MFSKEVYASVSFLYTRVPLIPNRHAAEILKKLVPCTKLIKPNC
jgi:hypothetical protein